MANSFYDEYFDQLMQGGHDHATDNLKVVLVDTGYVFSAAHEDLADVGVGARIATSGNLSTKTFTSGVFDADDLTFASVASGDTVDAAVLYQDTGVEATSRLIAYWDTDTGGAISIATNDGDINLTWDGGANKIFNLNS